MDMNRNTIVLNGAVFLLMLGVGLITPLLPGKVYNLSQSTVQVGTLAAAFACSYILVQVPLGIVADRFGYVRFIALGYCLCGAAGILYVLAASSPVLFAGRFIQGLGEAPVWALAPALLSLANEKNKGRVIGWYNASIHLGLTAGSLFGCIALNFSTELHILLAYILLCSIAAAWTAMAVQETRPDCTRPRGYPLFNRSEAVKVLRVPKVGAVLLGIGLYGVGYGVFMTIVPTYMTTVTISSLNLNGLLFICFYTGITFAQLIGGPFADSRGRVLPMLVGLSLYSAGVLSFFRAPFLSSLLLVAMASFGLGLFLVGSIAFLNDQAGEDAKGFISGLFYFFWGSGYVIGPIILGYAGKYGCFQLGFTGMGISGAVASLFIMLTCIGGVHENKRTIAQ